MEKEIISLKDSMELLDRKESSLQEALQVVPILDISIWKYDTY